MKTSSRLITICILTIGASSLIAQSRPPVPSSSSGKGTTVAVIDVAKVFKEHAQFKFKMERIKKDIQDFQGQVKQQREALTQRSQQLRDLKSGSPEFRRLEEELAKAASQLQVNAKIKQKQILDREAKVYYETYTEVVALVGRIAQHNGIDLVLRFDSERIDPADRGQVLKAVNRNVIFQHHHLDLTPIVLKQVAPRQAVVPGGGGLRK